MAIPTITLNNGIVMPQLGLGVWQAKDGPQVIQAVHTAIESGYRLLDTAAMYANEHGVGQAILTAPVSREDIFITTKLWNSDQGHDKALKAFDASLRRLQLDYVDLYLIHWPCPALGKYTDTWRAFEEIYASGRARAIGVCNFNQDHLERLLASATVPPAVNQIEFHPHFQQHDLQTYCSANGIQVEAWSPIGGSGGDILTDSTLQAVAKKHRKSPAQIILRWHLQQGRIVIPKSTHPERIRQNIDVFDFKLDDEDMSHIASCDTQTRRGPDPATMNRDVPTGLVQLASRLGIPRLRRT